MHQVYTYKWRQIHLPAYTYLTHALLRDSNGIQTHKHLIRKRMLNHLAKLAKWLRCVVSTYLTTW